MEENGDIIGNEYLKYLKIYININRDKGLKILKKYISINRKKTFKILEKNTEKEEGVDFIIWAITDKDFFSKYIEKIKQQRIKFENAEKLKKEEEQKQEQEFIKSLEGIEGHDFANKIAEYIFKNDIFSSSYFSLLGYSLKQIQDSKDKAMDFLLGYCILLIRGNDRMDLVKLIISNSLQNGVNDGIDLSKDFEELTGKDNMLDVIISHGNYEIFQILHNLGVEFKNIGSKLLRKSHYKDGVKNKRKIIIDLLKTGYKPTLDDLYSFIEFGNIEILDFIFKNNLIENYIKIIEDLLNKGKLDSFYRIRSLIANNIEIQNYLYSLVYKDKQLGTSQQKIIIGDSINIQIKDILQSYKFNDNALKALNDC